MSSGEANDGTEGQTEELSPAAGRILEAASRLFYEQGIRAVGVDAIVEEADVAKVTLYNNFGSKDELAAAYVRDRRGNWQRMDEDYARRVSRQRGDKRLLRDLRSRPSRQGRGSGVQGLDTELSPGAGGPS